MVKKFGELIRSVDALVLTSLQGRVTFAHDSPWFMGYEGPGIEWDDAEIQSYVEAVRKVAPGRERAKRQEIEQRMWESDPNP
ncbi:MAG: hypothetical protein M1305_06100 [Candidatus Marsarchaeota archaeon]|nr:hypothetical protein [Candidatus Marsarchaeota archaeon]